ncbi:MAG: hypothetical protein A3G07_00445 [Candidatus Doudnabacteria bacterium RIFCSPLOWO2_12_FULL_47_12]|nr:MAG: hypothetical protein A2668_03195 [Candidatus Doudnabacteria bacterium RIFCSPHIGHO2_01_FULL_48_180]OGF00363.1 MAG: hypothetical protein A3G07_00445 [Candidatus Doudnabacteria bacterium RIFCSPLOWO2_12_FULL_47_12]
MDTDIIRLYVINTGGTLGMVPQDPNDPESPLRPAKTGKELFRYIRRPQGVNLKITLEEFGLRDSNDYQHRDVVELCKMIAQAFKDGSHAVMVIYGSDALEEACADVEMTFQNSLPGPVFFEASKDPIVKPGTDAITNLESALVAIVDFVTRGFVGVYNACDHKVWDGRRICKVNSGYNMFDTPGMPKIADVGSGVDLMGNPRLKVDTATLETMTIDCVYESDVMTLKVSANTPPWALTNLVQGKPKPKGVILIGKGQGNISGRKWIDKDVGSWIDAVRLATDQGVHVGVISPFQDGKQNALLYDLGKKARNAGAIDLNRNTYPMAEIKFRKAIAKCQTLPFADQRKFIQEYVSSDHVGEIPEGEKYKAPYPVAI